MKNKSLPLMAAVQMQNKENEIKKFEADIAQAENISLEEITELIIDLEMTSDVIGDIGHSLESISDSIGTRTDNITQLEAKLLKSSLESINESLEFKLITNTDFKNKTAAQAMESISDTLSKIPEMIKSFIKNVVDFIKNLVKSVFSKIDGIEKRVESVKNTLQKSKDTYVDGGTFRNEHISKTLHTRKDRSYNSVPQAISMTWKAYMSAFGAAAHFVNVDFGKNLNGSFEEIIKAQLDGDSSKLNKLGVSLVDMLTHVCTEEIDSVHDIAKAPDENTIVYGYPNVLAGGLMMHCFVPKNQYGLKNTKFFMLSHDSDADVSNLEWSRLSHSTLSDIVTTVEDYLSNYKRAKSDSVHFLAKLEESGNQAAKLISSSHIGKTNYPNTENKITSRQVNEFFDLIRVTTTVVSKMVSVSLTESYKVVSAGLDYVNACLNSQST